MFVRDTVVMRSRHADSVMCACMCSFTVLRLSFHFCQWRLKREWFAQRKRSASKEDLPNGTKRVSSMDHSRVLTELPGTPTKYAEDSEEITNTVFIRTGKRPTVILKPLTSYV